MIQTSSPVRDIYEKAAQLPRNDRTELVAMLLDDLAPEPPNTIKSREHLIQLLEEGMLGEFHPVTEETWQQLREYISARAAAKSK